MAGHRGGAGRRRSAPDGPEEKPKTREELGTAARDQCIRLLAVRPRTRSELETALRKRGYDEDVISEVLDRYSDVGIIDDEAFAKAWVTSRHHSKGLAKRALAGELRRKGVSADDMGVALDELDGDAEIETARALVERRLRVERRRPGGTGDGVGDDRDAQRKAQAALIRKLVGMLARKGYPSGLAYRVVKEAMADDGGTGGLLDLDSYVEEPDDFDQLRS
ncbi:regulatory protein RecX [Virgisporangium aurantiacum]|uniref:Regulatory protein RecX n=1 Tax=Virgisporangium aurantiacum TaxID=175570 RepID=A0A8J4DWI1_9ACTN|nr:regulatory protein RecX [Virgisporangium aurantiacum]GIJ52899.1 regulatory protein RecX [Virgisporangium aurantiacum]